MKKMIRISDQKESPMIPLKGTLNVTETVHKR